MKRHTQSGFSLVEFLIAISILTIGILALVTMQATALNVQSRSKLSTNAQYVNQEVVERIISNAKDDQSIMSYCSSASTMKVSELSTKPLNNPGAADFDYFKTLAATLPGGDIEIIIDNSQKPYPALIRTRWRDGSISHKIDYATYLMPINK